MDKVQAWKDAGDIVGGLVEIENDGATVGVAVDGGGVSKDDINGVGIEVGAFGNVTGDREGPRLTSCIVGEAVAFANEGTRVGTPVAVLPEGASVTLSSTEGCRVG
jgi:hypothetical protein